MEATDRINDVPVYAPEGSVDINNSAALRDSMLKELTSGCRAVVLDLAEVQYIDSSGLSALVATVNGYEKQGGTVLLCSADPAVMKVLEMTRLTDYFTIAEDREEALQKAGQLIAG